MKPVPIVMALIVCGLVFVFVFQRDALLSVLGVEPEAETEEVVVEEAPQAVPVVVLRSQAAPVQSGLLLTGRAEAVRKVNVQAETSGIVISDPIAQGTQVAAGDLLCRLDPGSRAASLAEAEARLEEARLNEQAARTLSERGFSAATEAASRRAQLQAAQAQVEQAEKELERLEIRAPFGGILDTDTSELGSLLQPGALCATVVDLSQVKIVGFVPEAEVHRVQLRAQAGAQLLSGARVTGPVSFISRSADPLTKTFRVEFEVLNTSNIADGATAQIAIGLSGEDAHYVPQAALTLDDAGIIGVRVVEEGRAVFKEIDILRDDAEGVWVSGLAPNADVIVVGSEYVRDGSAVDVTLLEDQAL